MIVALSFQLSALSQSLQIAGDRLNLLAFELRAES
jgi:hypothetical protein